jgi:hypothetical protein
MGEHQASPSPNFGGEIKSRFSIENILALRGGGLRLVKFHELIYFSFKGIYEKYSIFGSTK